jgi:transcriptional regulator with XRE-family HTH domain
MKSRLAWYLRAKRRAKGLTIEALAMRLGYRNVRKGAHRILRFEHDGRCSHGLLVNLVDGLGLSYETVLDLVEKDVVRNLTAQFQREV